MVKKDMEKDKTPNMFLTLVFAGKDRFKESQDLMKRRKIWSKEDVPLVGKMTLGST